MADYRGKNVVIIGLGPSPGFLCVDFFLARGVTPRVMDTRMTPPGLDKLPEAVENATRARRNDEWLMAADLIVASRYCTGASILSAAADAGIRNRWRYRAVLS